MGDKAIVQNKQSTQCGGVEFFVLSIGKQWHGTVKSTVSVLKTGTYTVDPMLKTKKNKIMWYLFLWLKSQQWLRPFFGSPEADESKIIDQPLSRHTVFDWLWLYPTTEMNIHDNMGFEHLWCNYVHSTNKRRIALLLFFLTTEMSLLCYKSVLCLRSLLLVLLVHSWTSKTRASL